MNKKADLRSAAGEPIKIIFTDTGEEIRDYKLGP